MFLLNIVLSCNFCTLAPIKMSHFSNAYRHGAHKPTQLLAAFVKCMFRFVVFSMYNFIQIQEHML